MEPPGKPIQHSVHSVFPLLELCQEDKTAISEPIYNLAGCPAEVSVNKLIRDYGACNGLLLALKEINNHKHWHCSWFQLVTLHWWFIITLTTLRIRAAAHIWSNGS